MTTRTLTSEEWNRRLRELSDRLREPGLHVGERILVSDELSALIGTALRALVRQGDDPRRLNLAALVWGEHAQQQPMRGDTP